MSRVKVPNIACLLSIWFVITAINFGKAIHIDDTFYVEAATKILENPTGPMSGFINWTDQLEPIYENNQPPLWFYTIAVFGSVFGFSNYALHVLVSVFAFLCLFFFYKILKELQLKNKLLLIALLGLNPAFLVNQNVMTDIPLLSMILGFTYFLLKARKLNQFYLYLISTVFLSLAIFIKYSALPLLLVFLVLAFLDKRKNALISLLLPIALLLLWSAWNYWEFESYHLLGRSTNVQWKQTLTFLAGLGAISSFVVFLLFKLRKAFGYTFLVIIFLLGILTYSNLIDENLSKEFLQVLFLLIGFFIVVLLVAYFLPVVKDWKTFVKTNDFIFLLILLFLGSFLILKSPFMATRHILLLLPFILLVLHKRLTINNSIHKRVGLLFVFLFGLGLAISDWMVADYYRDFTKEDYSKNNSKVWSVGHWGWQWYAKNQNYEVYDFKTSKVNKGDVIIYPAKVPKQKISNQLDLELIEKKWKESNFATFLYVGNAASLYSNRLYKPVWMFSKQPIDTILVYKVKSVLD